MAKVKDNEKILKPAREKQLITRYGTSMRLSADGEIKSFINKQKLRVQHHQTSFTRNIKGASLSEKEATTKNMKIMIGKISLIKASTP